jgi:hypothetical protein
VARRTRDEGAPVCRVTFTFDTGMLIALERRKRRATEAFRAIVARGQRSGSRMGRLCHALLEQRALNPG